QFENLGRSLRVPELLLAVRHGNVRGDLSPHSEVGLDRECRFRKRLALLVVAMTPGELRCVYQDPRSEPSRCLVGPCKSGLKSLASFSPVATLDPKALAGHEEPELLLGLCFLLVQPVER